MDDSDEPVLGPFHIVRTAKAHNNGMTRMKMMKTAGEKKKKHKTTTTKKRSGDEPKYDVGYSAIPAAEPTA